MSENVHEIRAREISREIDAWKSGATPARDPAHRKRTITRLQRARDRELDLARKAVGLLERLPEHRAARDALEIAREEARALRALERARKMVPTGIEITNAARYFVVHNDSGALTARVRAHAARRHRLAMLLRRISKAEAAGASARRVAWARACVGIMQALPEATVEMKPPPALPLLRCGRCWGSDCDHPLEEKR
jgi:hypothetical protein